MSSTQFKIEEKISESGTTSVYRAFDTVLHRRVLLKVLHKHLANDHHLSERFIREARACAALRGEHIVQVYDLTDIDEAPAIVMEFVEGKSLKDVIVDQTNRNFDFAKKVAVHVLRGLEMAHDRGIIHRDIKPGNILVSDSGAVKVTDFGLAYVALSPTVTMEGMVLGTPAYMAPEQVRGDEADARTDLFSLGATLVELLSGERIFEGATYSECIKKVLAFTPSELEQYSDRSSPEFVQFLQKLMHPKKEERYSSATEALTVLDEKKSSGFFPPVPASSLKKRVAIPLGAGIIVLSLFIVFDWMKLANQPQVRGVVPDSVRIIVPLNESSLRPDTHTIEAAEDSNVRTVQPSNLQTFKSVTENKESKKKSPAANDSGKVFLTGTPWAKVYVNNQLVGETPIAKPVVLPAGSHAIMFTHPSFDPIVQTVNVEADREITVAGNFIQQAGYLMCIVIPWAEVFVDEQYKDTTPLSKPIMLSAGKHTVRFKNPAFADVVKDVTISRQDTTALTITFAK